MEKEEGEMSDDSSMVVDVVAEPLRRNEDDNYTVLYRPEKHGLIVEKLEKADASKFEERARRFGINLSGNKVVTQKQINELYEHLNISNGSERHIRLDTLHLKGVEGLTTKEVFEYLQDYRPVSLEWINNSSCNIVCQDNISAALAMLVHSRDILDENIKKIASSSPPFTWRESLPHPKNDLILMRFATNSDKKDGSKDIQINTNNHKTLTTVNTDDNSGKNPWGDLCKSWGVYDHQEVYGPRLPPKSINIHTRNIVESSDDDKKFIPKIQNKSLARRLGKRQSDNKNNDESGSDSDNEWKKKSKLPRMRMHADDEELLKVKKVSSDKGGGKEDYVPLSIQIINNNENNTRTRLGTTILSEKFATSGLKSRLGEPISRVKSRLGKQPSKYNSDHASNDDSSSSSSSSNSSTEINVQSRVQRAPVCTKPSSSVWKRLEKKSAFSSIQSSDLRHSIKSKTKTASNTENLMDLRKIIGDKSKRTKSPLRIEIDNEYYKSD